MDVAGQVANILDFIGLFDHLGDCGQQIRKLSLVLHRDRLDIKFVHKLDESTKLALGIEAGPDEAILDDGEPDRIIDLRSVAHIIVAVVHHLDFLGCDGDARDTAILRQPHDDRFESGWVQHTFDRLIGLSGVWRGLLSHVLSSMELEETPVTRIDEKQSAAFEVEKFRELPLECGTERCMLLLAHELAEGIEDLVGTFSS